MYTNNKIASALALLWATTACTTNAMLDCSGVNDSVQASLNAGYPVEAALKVKILGHTNRMYKFYAQVQDTYRLDDLIGPNEGRNCPEVWFQEGLEIIVDDYAGFRLGEEYVVFGSLDSIDYDGTGQVLQAEFRSNPCRQREFAGLTSTEQNFLEQNRQCTLEDDTTSSSSPSTQLDVYNRKRVFFSRSKCESFNGQGNCQTKKAGLVKVFVGKFCRDGYVDIGGGRCQQTRESMVEQCFMDAVSMGICNWKNWSDLVIECDLMSIPEEHHDALVPIVRANECTFDAVYSVFN